MELKIAILKTTHVTTPVMTLEILELQDPSNDDT